MRRGLGGGDVYAIVSRGHQNVFSSLPSALSMSACARLSLNFPFSILPHRTKRFDDTQWRAQIGRHHRRQRHS